MKMKNQKGITLIALVITIIVMLILVGVSVTVALNGGLFATAKDAANETKTERDKEMALSNGTVKIGETTYDSIEEYVNSSEQKTITFYIQMLSGEKATYTAYEGMTWREWVENSELNNTGFYIQNSFVYTPGDPLFIVDFDGGIIADKVIVENYTYEQM